MNERRSPRVAIVGTGNHARSNIYPVLVQTGFELVAACARSAETAAAARRFGVEATYAGLDEFIPAVKGQIDGAILVLPPDGYEEPVLRCLELGVPLLCEKPVAFSSASIARMETAASKAGVPVMVGYMKRFGSAYRRAHEISTGPGFGPLCAFQARWAMGPAFTDPGFFLLENATHMLDLARYFMGEVDDVTVQAYESAPGIFTFGVLARFAAGGIGTIEITGAGSFDHPSEHVTVTGKGAAVLVENVDTVKFRAQGQPEQVWRPNYTVPMAEMSSAATGGFLGVVQHFAKVALEGAAPETDLSSAKRTTALAEQILQQARASLESSTPQPGTGVKQLAEVR